VCLDARGEHDIGETSHRPLGGEAKGEHNRPPNTAPTALGGKCAPGVHGDAQLEGTKGDGVESRAQAARALNDRRVCGCVPKQGRWLAIVKQKPADDGDEAWE
jgi:hypothetical protein